MPEQRIIIDFGPNVLPFALALFGFLSSVVAAYFAFASKKAIDQANGHLALVVSQASNQAGQSKLTISPLSDQTK